LARRHPEAAGAARAGEAARRGQVVPGWAWKKWKRKRKKEGRKGTKGQKIWRTNRVSLSWWLWSPFGGSEPAGFAQVSLLGFQARPVSFFFFFSSVSLCLDFFASTSVLSSTWRTANQPFCYCCCAISVSPPTFVFVKNWGEKNDQNLTKKRSETKLNVITTEE